MPDSDILDHLDSVNERIRGLSMIALLLVRADPQEDYRPLYQVLYQNLESLASETDLLLHALETGDE